MQFTFLDMAGGTLFIRDDAERAQWTQEEMTLEMEFPRVADKVISIGQRVYFVDPSTGEQQIYEVKQAQTHEPDHYQSVTAENICISELSDEHINETELDNLTAKNALQTALNGTLWAVGTNTVNPVSSGNLTRGSVWQAVLEITDNWNVYIVPRVTLSSNGTITRYLDIKPTDGETNGVRLSIDKNMLDPTVTFDDSEVYTAMYGYGGTIPSSSTTQPDTECTFKDVVWQATSQHPAKPAGQTYLEDPAATQAYGRNGRARFGFYQNNDITDPNILLEKTWESLQAASKPAISIEGTVEDLYRLGYADQPIKLHDVAMVEVNPAGYKSQVQIIRMTVDLLDPSATTVTLGSYIPNIVYIERNTNEDATGSRGGGGRNSNKETNTWQEFRTSIMQIDNGTALRFQSVQNDINNQEEEIAIQSGRIDVAYDKITAEVTDRREADNVLNANITVQANRITQEVTRASTAEGTLSGRITTEAGKIEQIVTAVGTNGQVTAASICLAINRAGSTATINADKIYLLGQTIANTVTADYIDTRVQTIANVQVKRLTVTGSGYISLSSGDGNVNITGSAASDFIRNLRFQTSGNTYTLQKVTLGDATWTDVGSFSRAVSSFVWGGGSGKINVTALPQNQTQSVNVSIDGQPTITTNGTYTYGVDYENADGDDVPTGATKDIVVSVSNAISSWVWGGGSGKVNVTALPQNQTKSVNVSIDGNASITSNGDYVYTVDYENADGDDVSTGATKTVTVAVKPTKSQIGASRSARHSSEPAADGTLSGVVANGWYVITVSVLGQTKTYKIEIDV